MRSEPGFNQLLEPIAILAGDSLALRPWVAANSGEKRTVRAERRRPGDSQPGERPRAEAPQRQREDQGSGGRPPGGSGGYRPPSPGGMFPGGGGKPTLAGIIVLVLIVICGLPLMLLFGGGGSDDSTGGQPPSNQEGDNFEQPAEIPVSRATATPRPRVATLTPRPQVARPSSSTPGQRWLVMLYQDADDKVLEQDLFVDLNEAERVGSTDQVQIVAQIDRFRAGFRGDGDWTDTRRYYVTQDDDLDRVNSEVATDLGETNMADGNTLVDFATWAIQTYPADKYVLILSDHGMGWPGGWSDQEPRGAGDPSVPLEAALQGDHLYLNEMDDALGEIRAQTGVVQFEMVGLDACLMAHLEVLSALAPHARYVVVSQETEPALGWAYTDFLEGLNANPDMDGAGLGKLIVNSYIEGDQRIVDPQARAKFLREGSAMGGLFGAKNISADQLAQEMEQDITLTAVDLTALPALTDSVNNFAFTLQQADQRVVAKARTYAQSFTSIFGDEVPPSYIDLGHFVQLLGNESGDSNVAQAADGVMAALGQVIIAEKHGPDKPGATGISIYFPNSQLYRSPVTGAESYTDIASRFAAESLWDDFLDYHYTGRSFERGVAAAAIPQRGATIQAPGAGQIRLSPITLSGQVAAPGQPVLISSDVSGDNIGYIYIFSGFYDQASNSIFVADMDYLQSGDTRQLNGVYYPDWGQGDFTLEFEWEPLMFSVSDGTTSELTLLKPQSYGAAPEEAVYTVDGTYTYADSGESLPARLYIRDGLMRQVFGFTGSADAGAPREIIPQAGDTFTIQQQWLDLDQQGNVVQQATQAGQTLTFSDQPFTWKELNGAPGDYIVGFVVEDLDGNQTESYTQVTVQ